MMQNIDRKRGLRIETHEALRDVLREQFAAAATEDGDWDKEVAAFVDSLAERGYYIVGPDDLKPS